MGVLFINSCVRQESRTLIVAEEYLKSVTGEITRLNLVEERLEPLNTARLEERERLLSNGVLSDDFFAYARQFAEAEEIVIAAPFWDLSFPALLKTYFENVSVGGITFRYDNGIPVGLCHAKKLTYVTTAGGKVFADFGYSYVKTLATALYGIKDVSCILVENLDVKCISGNSVLKEPIIKIK